MGKIYSWENLNIPAGFSEISDVTVSSPVSISNLVFADGHLKIRFSFTRGSYKNFLLRHGSFSYIIRG